MSRPVLLFNNDNGGEDIFVVEWWIFLILSDADVRCGDSDRVWRYEESWRWWCGFQIVVPVVVCNRFVLYKLFNNWPKARFNSKFIPNWFCIAWIVLFSTTLLLLFGCGCSIFAFNCLLNSCTKAMSKLLDWSLIVCWFSQLLSSSRCCLSCQKSFFILVLFLFFSFRFLPHTTVTTTTTAKSLSFDVWNF